MKRDTVSGLDRCYARPDRFHNAGNFVAEA